MEKSFGCAISVSLQSHSIKRKRVSVCFLLFNDSISLMCFILSTGQFFTFEENKFLKRTLAIVAARHELQIIQMVKPGF